MTANHLIARFALSVTLAAFAVDASGALAQSATAQNRDVSVESDQMEFIDADKKAVFTGNVNALRGDVRLNSNVLTVFYQDRKKNAATTTAAAPAAGTEPAQQQPAPNTDVTKIDAQGNVVITTPRERITGEWAKIDVAADTLTVGGNVVLTQGTSILSGQQLVVDLKTNRTTMTGGRVKGQFVPQ